MTVLLAAVALLIGLGRRGVRRGGAALLLCVMLVAFGVMFGNSDWQDASRRLVLVLVGVGVPWLMGTAWRLRTEVRSHAAERVSEVRGRQRAARQQERDAERLALAESLHDDLGHALSLVALNLGRLELDAALAPSARQQIATARGQVSHAVARLGSSVASLRDGSPLGLLPREEVSDLLEHARHAGAEIVVKGAMPSIDQLARFDTPTLVRVLREALTNAVKHAPGSPVTIELRKRGDMLRLDVCNAIMDEADRTGNEYRSGGTGLAALRRHVRAIGGHLVSTDTADSFVVRADIPPRHRAVAGEEVNEVDEDHRDNEAEMVLAGGRRRGRVILACGALLVIAILAVAEVLQAVDVRRAVLPTADFAQIGVGDSRTEVEFLLPDHELSPQPSRAPGVDCHDYAVTVDPLDDASGDAYRICFDDNEVTVAKLIVGGEQ